MLGFEIVSYPSISERQNHTFLTLYLWTWNADAIWPCF